jgi:hypothetical protein
VPLVRFTTTIADDRVTLDRLADRAGALLAVVGLAALALAALLGWMRGDHLSYFLHAYLTSYGFFLSVSLGALFFVLIQHATRAGWSVAVRRIAEILAANIPMLAILFLPIVIPMLLDNYSLYPWTDPRLVAQSDLLQHKQAYLDVPFFGARCVLYLAIWQWLSRYFLGRSVQQDQSGDPRLTSAMERLSGPALLLYGGTVTFAAFDWFMSLEPKWFSTIYGVYFFSGAIVAGIAAIILAAVALQASARLTQSITVEHYHDLGKLLFAFVIFWGYIAFSQYLLIWYANIPEETIYYRLRQTGGWAGVSLLLLFGHLLIPFFGLLPRAMKRRKLFLALWAVWLLVFHWVDMAWLVMPSCDVQAGPRFGLIDVCLILGLGSLFLAGALRVARDVPLVPLKDPRLGESLAFENV